MNRIVLGVILVIAGLILMGSVFLLSNGSATDTILPEQTADSDEEDIVDKTSPTPITSSAVSMYAQYENKKCDTDTECGKLNCINGQCLVQRCQEDTDCPAGLWCGKGLHPAPGMCSKFPGAL